MNKKGALELSMSTVVIVIIAVVLLSLGIVFVRNMMGKISGLSETSFIEADEAIQGLMGGDQEFYISGTSFEEKAGGVISIVGGIQNFEGKDMRFKLSVTAADETSDISWVNVPTSLFVKAGEKNGFPVEIRIPKTAKSGNTYMYSIDAYDEANQPYGSEVIAINVK